MTPSGPAAEKCVRRDPVFISQRRRVGVDPKIELLPEELPCPGLGPQVPHPHIVQRKVDSCPRLRVDLHNGIQ